MQQELKSNLWKFYVFTFLYNFVVFLPFIVFYFQKLGFSLGSIMLIMGSYNLVSIILTIPGGYFADRFGRKASMIIGALLGVISVFILFNSTSFFPLLLAHIVEGLAFAFLSGADSAFLYDTLLSLKKEKEYKRYEGRANFFGEVALVLSALLGALVVKQFGIPATIFITLLIYVLMFLFMFSFAEPPRHKRIEKVPIKKEGSALLNIMKKSLHDKKLLGLFIYSFIVLGLLGTVFRIYQPYFAATHLDLPSFGLVFAAFSVFAGLSSLKVHEIELKLGVFWSLFLIPLFIALSFIFAGIFFVWWGFVFFFIRELARGFVFPVLHDYVNRLVSSKERATVLSIRGMFEGLGFFAIPLVFGIFSDHYSLRPTMIVTGAILLVATVIVSVLISKKEKVRTNA